MTRVSRDLIERYLRGDLTATESAAVEAAMATDPSVGALVDELAAAALEEQAAAAPNPWRSIEDDPTGPAAQAMRGVVAELARRRRPSPLPTLLAVAALMGIAVGVWALLPLRGDPLPELAEKVCAQARSATLPLRPSLGCDVQPDVTLGLPGSRELTELRLRVDSLSDAGGPDWLKTRALVGLLEGRPEDVVSLLETSAALQTDPSLHADLAIAWLQLGDRVKAQQALEAGLRLDPSSQVLAENLALLR